MQLNVAPQRSPVFTHEGAQASKINPEQQLIRSVMACMLWEGTFYEDGREIATRIGELIPKCRPDFVAACAFHARTDMKLRHVPLLIVAHMTRLANMKGLVSRLLADVIQRPDEITEFLAIYHSIGSRVLSAQVKKGLARAFQKFDEYALAKYNRDGPWKLRDALFLSHSRPNDVPSGYVWTKEHRKNPGVLKKPICLTPRERLYQRLVDGELAVPDTWEVQLSAGADKRETFERLMAEKKLGALAFLRNLRNMVQANVSTTIIAEYAVTLPVDRVLPFRFIAAARAVPQLEPVLEPLMLKCLSGATKLPGRTVLLVDVSGSMDHAISAKSDLRRIDAACGLAILMRELCEDVITVTFSNALASIPPRRGFALRDAIVGSQLHGGTYLGRAIETIHANPANTYDRVVVITDEQSRDRIPVPRSPRGYVINVATNKNGVGYGAWVHVDGWSEAVIDYIKAFEGQE